MESVSAGFKQLAKLVLHDPKKLGVDRDIFNTWPVTEQAQHLKKKLEDLNPNFKQDKIFQDMFMTVAMIELLEIVLAKSQPVY